MSAQVIELLLFAGVAFFLVTKLLAVLGTTNENDGKSFFGEPGGMKDVTSAPFKIDKKSDFADLISPNASSGLVQNINMISERIPSFDIRRFIEGSKTAFKMIVEALVKKDKETMGALVDKRFLEEFESSAERYESMDITGALDAKVSEGYMFGNSAFLKIVFSCGKTSEEWTFTKNVSVNGPDWYLSNVEVV